ncbi:MAG: hypothetical protein Q4G23_03370 [Clostridia bacterium]|nr:hypothetical protein [Clostridia bacterium]
MNELTKDQLFKTIDSEKLDKYIRFHNVNKSEVCTKAYLNRHFLNDATRKGRARIASFNAICDVMGVPRDYFDKFIEPEPVPEPEKEEPEECLINLADIQLSLNKIEALLLEQNRILRGKLEKGGNNEIKGNTNHGFSHGYTVVPTNL